MSNSIGSSYATRPEYGRQIQSRREPPPSTANTTNRFRGAQLTAQSEESASLTVKTADGDTVRISLAALSRTEAGAYAAQAGSAEASSSTYSSESGVAVSVEVEGSLDKKEVSDISKLLRRLVNVARSGRETLAPPEALQTGAMKSLDSYQFAYSAYQRASVATLDAQAA